MVVQSQAIRLGYLLSGWTSLTLGFIGIFLPLLPTTPFVLLSAYCFSKSSPRLHHWLIHQPTLGPMIQNWERYGSISRGAKITATVLLVGLFIVTFLVLQIGAILKVLLLCIATGVLSYIWTRPSYSLSNSHPQVVSAKLIQPDSAPPLYPKLGSIFAVFNNEQKVK